MSWDHEARPDVVVPPMPTAPPPAPADPWRAFAVAFLNLSGLGLGYALVRRWGLMIACLAATGILLVVALPADPNGVPGPLVVLYLILLVAAAAHGAWLGLRTRLAWPPNPLVAAGLGIVLLAVPAGGVVLYDGARDEATEQMLLDRLEQANELVTSGGTRPFELAQTEYRQALTIYHGLTADHPASRAAARVPDRLKTYYSTVAAPYSEQNYCGAVPPLKYLRTVPRTMDKKALGSLSTWPDDRLATSLYECAATSMSGRTADWPTQFGELLSTFPNSEQAKKVEPAIAAEVGKAVKSVRGNDPCAAVERLDSLSTQIRGVSGEQAGLTDALDKDADRADRSATSGTYNCGVDQYKDGSFSEAITSMNKFIKDNPGSANRSRARKIAIAAEVAETVPAAGKRLPTTRSGGSITVTVKNDSPDDITVMYTGPVTGSFSLKACGSCSTYSSLLTSLGSNSEPCSDSGKNYPQKTIRLPAGTTYFVHKSQTGLGKSPASDTAKLTPGYIYTECAYTTSLGY
ncbi:outer membrane protein assembly factor BamD (BamD/ComL family) [Streptomyces pseudovenezuelae]|uniref:Outer membrane protein assembly factor BamD (BamD/ComL family) n=2 Tax=Streptomyces pseudovenezuelae TaxID=67350 RepID=A0ABT6LVG3_9ACTN|nr:outer membrane protein assembly factor BamD (BamD/ComL family) [Streptomyces pseudovenezuelae]